jgi:flagellar motility protein MotE (MotC chaperone)/uncharacterized low-complexity protein
VANRAVLLGGLAVALATGSVIARASTEKAAPPQAKAAETQAAASKPVESKPVESKAGDPKAAEAKAADGKPGEGKAPEGKAGETKAGESKPGDKVGESEPAAPKPAKSKWYKKPNASKQPPSNPGEGPSPASPPPLTMGGLRDELRRESVPGKIDPAAAPRTKVEQMLTEIVKTREALHAETLRLEAMMAQEPPEAAAPAAAGGAAGAPGAKPAKNPLDILAKALRGIKPEQAAPIVSRLDKRLAATVLQRMPPVDAGKIMGAMKPDTAAELATQIAMRTPGADARGEGKK